MPEIIVIAHNIRSTHNIGSIFRTCEGFGVSKIIISGYSPYPKLSNDTRLPHMIEKLTNQIHKTALGAETMVQCRYYENLDLKIYKNKDILSSALNKMKKVFQSINSIPHKKLLCYWVRKLMA